MKQMPAKRNPSPDGRSSRLKCFALATVLLALCFAFPLYDLAWFAATSEFHSYILLIPFISAYLVSLKKGSIPISSQPARKTSLVFLTAGTAILVAYWLFLRPHLKLIEDDYLAVMMFSF